MLQAAKLPSWSRNVIDISAIRQGTYDFFLVFHCNHVPILMYRHRDIISYFTRLNTLRDPEYIPSGVIYHVYTNTCQYQSACIMLSA